MSLWLGAFILVIACLAAITIIYICLSPVVTLIKEWKNQLAISQEQNYDCQLRIDKMHEKLESSFNRQIDVAQQVAFENAKVLEKYNESNAATVRALDKIERTYRMYLLKIDPHAEGD